MKHKRKLTEAVDPERSFRTFWPHWDYKCRTFCTDWPRSICCQCMSRNAMRRRLRKSINRDVKTKQKKETHVNQVVLIARFQVPQERAFIQIAQIDHVIDAFVWYLRTWRHFVERFQLVNLFLRIESWNKKIKKKQKNGSLGISLTLPLKFVSINTDLFARFSSTISPGIG